MAEKDKELEALDGAPLARVPLTLPPEYAALGLEKERLSTEAAKIGIQRRALRNAAMEAAGWKRCCRCYPRAVGDDGFCGCCNFNHVTGKSLGGDDVDFGDTD